MVEMYNQDEQTVQDYFRRIDNAIIDFCNLDIFPESLNLSSASTAQFNACLMYIANTVICHIDNIYRHNDIDYNNPIITDGLLNKYISICYLYNKIPSAYGFYTMLGMSSKTYYSFANSDNEQRRKIVKILTNLHERGLLEKLEDSKSPVGQIAAGNVVHNWDGRKAAFSDNAKQIESSVIASKYLQLETDQNEIVSDFETISENNSNNWE